MTDRELEERLRGFYRTEVQKGETAPVALRQDVAAIPRTVPLRAGRLVRGRALTLLAAAALLVVGGAVAAGSSLLRLPAVVPPEPLPSLAADATPTPAKESSTPTAVTSPVPSERSSLVPVKAASWMATGTMVTSRYGHTAVRLLDGRVLVAGGSGGPKGGANPEFDLTSAELYDPDRGTWSATGNMLWPHAGFPATLLRDGKVLVGDVRNPFSGAELYDPVTGTWSSTGKLVITEEWLGGTAATLLANGKVLVTGFHGSELYDPDSGNWTATGKMITPRYNHTATLLPDARVLVAGGDVPPDHAVDSAELYDPDTGSWTATANLRATGNTRFDIITATLLRDGTVLVVRPSSAELYDAATGTWTATGEQPRPGTSYRSATLLSDGMVLVPLNDADAAWPGFTAAELYDPSTGSWTTTATMLRWHNLAPATLLLDGTVLVAGGIDCRDGSGCPTGATGSAELYIPAGVSPPAGLPAAPDPTPTPVPTPSPTPVPPRAGPVPPGARTWEVKVVNKSSEPATLFVAEEDASGMGRLVGS
jgi:Galactose oxidase, central domain